MHTTKRILTAFLLNLGFAVLELVGGLYTGSIAILSDALHDFGDAVSVGLSFALEKKSEQQPDATHTYGYARYSVLGAFITTLVLTVGSCIVIGSAVNRLFHPVPLHYDGIVWMAVFGVTVNALAAFFTKGGHSLNQRAVNLHMLEDVFGWAVVLIGAILMKFTAFAWLDAVLSIGLAVFILIHALRSLADIVRLFLMQTPNGMDVSDIAEQITALDGVVDVHHIHVFSMDGEAHYATMHITADTDDTASLKERVRHTLHDLGIAHATLELETRGEHCPNRVCTVHACAHSHGHHHHHH